MAKPRPRLSVENATANAPRWNTLMELCRSKCDSQPDRCFYMHKLQGVPKFVFILIHFPSTVGKLCRDLKKFFMV